MIPSFILIVYSHQAETFSISSSFAVIRSSFQSDFNDEIKDFPLESWEHLSNVLAGKINAIASARSEGAYYQWIGDFLHPGNEVTVIVFNTREELMRVVSKVEEQDTALYPGTDPERF
jgi:hypothetical protein